MRSENLTKVLYPDDTTPQGKRLRLEQQYFFVACSLADILRLLAPLGRRPAPPPRAGGDAAQRHPPQHRRRRADAPAGGRARPGVGARPGTITRRVFAYTCHTLLPEALEKWPVALFESLLPAPPGDHLRDQPALPGGGGGALTPATPPAWRGCRSSRSSAGRRVRMAHLATVGSFAVNGVAELHSRLLRETVLRDFSELWPEKFRNKTNGVTPRRFVGLANPGLTELLTSRLAATAG